MQVSIRTHRRLYAVLTLAVGVAVVWVWIAGIHSIRRDLDASTSAFDRGMDSATARNSTDLSTSTGVPPLTAFREANWQRTLRAPLYDPPPPPPPEVKPPPPLTLKLLGTVIEPDGRSQAILTTASGQVEMHRVGDTIDNATLQSIEANAVTVQYYDQLITLTPPAPGTF